MLNTRILTDKDRVEASRLTELFVKTERPDVDVSACLNFLHLFLKGGSDIVAIGLEDGNEIVGILCGMAPVNNPMSFPRIVSTEVLFYVLPQYRKIGGGELLLNHFEEWSCLAGATEVIFGCKAGDEKMMKYYSKFGYLPFETTMIRKIV